MIEIDKPHTITKKSSSDAVEPDFAIANVQCHYESGSDGEEARPAPSRPHRPPDDHTYDTRDEPPAFIIHQIPSAPPPTTQAPLQASKIMTLGPGYPPAVNVIHVGNSMEILHTPPPPPAPTELCKRIRRSEELLKQAADCVSRGFTFQMVSDQFNIPISTIRFFMARKGILPRRRRGRSTQAPVLRSCSPEPPFHMQHFKLPDMLALQGDDDDSKP